MLKESIKGFVKYVSEHPGMDVALIADDFLSGNIESSSAKDIVLPEILMLTPSKRALVINIVRSKTNCNLYSDNDYMHNYVSLKEVGEVMRKIPESSKKIKWLSQ